MYLLDTNVLSEIRKVHRANPTVWAWSQVTPADLLYISAVSVLEIEQGVLLVERRDSQQGRLFSDWLRKRILPQFEGRILAFDTEAALRCAALHIPDPRPERDAMIAATAQVHALTVVTRNTADFARSGVATLNPWLASA
ncbi:VapC toxin family PIN domain ribonuclease [Bosea sp. Tri-44]|uniref:type II toxin-antitoxin system VapC family toxin n=1 Tax=Bosea sp. Tri-44 TaxID=1972137 RepID=UPI00100EE8D1|nr:type II toxin-antitoxin system VapC family toxin [Bosea sp. Tri-44]RXT50234.1 VapC toxin family PIN domain ribonuclease [Bosea sp. Tri-44]